MLKVYVDSVNYEDNYDDVKISLNLSTESGDKACVKISEKSDNSEDVMAKLLSKYASGVYSKAENKFVADCDAKDSMQGYEKYELIYCPEYVEREFAGSPEVVSGYSFGSWNPIYDGKVSVTIMDISYDVNDNEFYANIGLVDDNDVIIESYSATCGKNENRNEFVLGMVKKLANNYFYSVENGKWDLFTGDNETKTCYYVDLDFEDDEILSQDFAVEK